MEQAIHQCRRCRQDVKCPYCFTPGNYICPWINDDEDDMCEACLETTQNEMYEWIDSGEEI